MIHCIFILDIHIITIIYNSVINIHYTQSILICKKHNINAEVLKLQNNFPMLLHWKRKAVDLNNKRFDYKSLLLL